jgi:hypothetical protein
MIPRIAPPKIQTVAQKLPANLGVGSILYKAIAEYDDDTHRARTLLKEWHVTSIKRKGAGDDAPTIYLVQKVDGATWGKLSSKTGDYGWLPSIGSDWRDSFVHGVYMASGYATTPAKAYALAIGDSKHRIKRYKAWDSEPGSIGFSVCIDACLVEIEALERRRKIAANKRKTTKSDP